jgi:hypothetical protein
MSSENILTKGYPLVRFEEEQLEYLMKIRRSEMDYDDLMKEVICRMEKLKELYKSSTVIPDTINKDKVVELYKILAETPTPIYIAEWENKICKCGHTYYRHFDTYQKMKPVGCKYCQCWEFEEV